ncbi:MAG: Rid family detoxifying hydrolase [bacterium]|nr:Rid family detoxifying hydrolase [bacterium]
MEKKIILTTTAPAPIGPYSQAVLIGNTLYCSGQIALTIDGTLVTDSIEAETKQVMHNIGELLKAAQMDYSHIVKTSIFLTDMGDFSKVNGVYASYFSSDFPARETIQVSALPKGVHVEISVTAIK